MAPTRFFMLAALVVTEACGGASGTGPTPPSPPPSSNISVAASYFPNVVVGGALPAIARFTPPLNPQWTSQNPSVVGVGADGMITGLTAGSSLIKASVSQGTSSASAQRIVEVVPPFVRIVLGSIFSCGQTSTGSLYCWGANGTNQLGRGESPDFCETNSSPCAMTPYTTFANPVLGQVALGYGMGCGLTAAGEIWCWGNNQSGQLGQPVGNLTAPVRVPGAVRLTQLAVGRFFGCGLDAEGHAYCWGLAHDKLGNLGAPPTGQCISTACSLEPVRVTGDLTFTSLTVGQLHTCALTPVGDAYCWGLNGSGALGNGRRSAIDEGDQVPQLVLGGIHFASISAGEITTCGVSTAGAAYCWGDNSEGELGIGESGFDAKLVPVPVVGGLVFASVHAGGVHTCGLTTDGKAYCWGRDLHGQLGDGGTDERDAPVAVAGNRTFVELQVRRGHSCGRTVSGMVYCWGQNFYGQLGVGYDPPGTQFLVPKGVGGAP